MSEKDVKVEETEDLNLDDLDEVAGGNSSNNSTEPDEIVQKIRTISTEDMKIHTVGTTKYKLINS